MAQKTLVLQPKFALDGSVKVKCFNFQVKSHTFVQLQLFQFWGQQKMDISKLQDCCFIMNKKQLDIWKHQWLYSQWPIRCIPDLSAPPGGSWESWLSSHAMKSLVSLSSLLFLLSSAGGFLSQPGRCASSDLSFLSRESSPGFCFAGVSSASLSSLSRLKPKLWPGLEAKGQQTSRHISWASKSLKRHLHIKQET